MPMDLTSDDDLMLMYANGDADAFDTLFDRYHVSVYNFARTMLGPAGGAEDVLQEAFLTLAQTARSYEPMGKFRSWLMKIARNLCLNRLRAERIRQNVLSQERSNGAADSGRNSSPVDIAEDNERTVAIRDAIGRLPDRQREALGLYAFQQMSYREISEVLDTPMNTVKSLIFRARANLTQNSDYQKKENKREL